MSQTSHDARAVVRALDALTTQVGRIADAVTTTDPERDDAPTTTPDDGPCAQHPHAPVIGGHCGGCTIYPADMRQAPAADEDALRTTRRDSLLVLLSRAQRGVLSTHEAELLRHHVEAEVHESNQWRAGRNTMKRRGEEIERDRDDWQRRAEQAEDLLRVAHETSNRSEAERASAVQRANIFETELRVLRAGLRANGADPTQIQNLWAQIRLRNRQWRDAKRERDQAQAAIERVRALHRKASHGTTCVYCAHGQRLGYDTDWPCDTLRALDGTEQPTTCTATIPAVINSTPDQCVAPAGHYDESNEPVFTGPERSPGGWHTNGKGHMWSDRAAAATPHGQQPTTEAEGCCGKPGGAICIHDVSQPKEQ
ncbi:hypothetical protein [Streptomyces cahuitamycinicus]|uniref:Uncharacterized protein n=1 Tax=Streptomyces cahuitamycinicus TaxID=2070367 RepID=A0A2N8TEX9_9ACTN|nr:hypothetical protein [Streptomyces cahuitamycinicus]PNG17596.1 hypothetical protein C1J00_35705 [Streptomyces cahuitamycinicus]